MKHCLMLPCVMKRRIKGCGLYARTVQTMFNIYNLYFILAIKNIQASLSNLEQRVANIEVS